MTKLPVWLLIALLALFGCGDGDDSSDDASSGTAAGGSDPGSGGNAGDGGSAGDCCAGGGGAGAGGNGGAPGNGTCSYPGIPHPTDMLPAGIMPTLPTPDVQAGFPYDPCAIATPTPSGGANEIIVNPGDTFPSGNFSAGTIIFVNGDNSPYGTVDYDFNEIDMSFNCTEAEPCWIVGIDRPRLGYRIDFSNSSHLLIDGISVVDTPTGGRPWGRLQFSDSQYITMRNTEVRGSGESSSGGNAVSMNNVEFMVTFQSQIHSAGSWDSNPQDRDVHGWRPAYGNRYLWLLDSELYHLQADGVQTGNSNNPNPQSETSHYIYIGGNVFYENYENALDNKNSYHVIFSSNDVHDFYPAQGASGANGTAVILSNNSEGPWTSYHWAINNRIWNTSLAIRDSGSEPGERNFMVGNTVWNADTAFLQANNDPDRELWVINNTASGSNVAYDMFQPGSNASVFIRYNIFHNAGSMDTMSDVNSVLENNILFGTTVDGQWDSNSGNLTEDPLLTDPDNGDMTPAAASPAVGAASEDPVYALFDSLYGLDIRQDMHGTARPQSDWDIGAIEVP